MSAVPRPVPERPRFTLDITDRRGGGAVVALAGDLDLATATDAGARIREQLARGPVRLDLRELDFMDSSGVRLLDELLRDAERAGRSLSVHPELQVGVRRGLEITGMLDALPFETGEREAG